MWVYIPYTRLPSAYQEVEYIQSSGTQYFVVWTSFKTSYKSVIDFQMTQIWWDYILFWVTDNSQWRYGIDFWQGLKVINWWSGWTSTISEDTNRHTVTINKSTATVDGTDYTTGYVDRTVSGGIWVFCYNEYTQSSPYNYKASAKLYKLDIYDENWVHIYDLVPCYRKSDNVIWMYDLVNNQFYTNSWTGTFSKGNDVIISELKNAYIGVAPIDTPWIYHNATLWLISLSSDGSTRYTIADKNLWATTSDVTSTASYWDYYSRWALQNRNWQSASWYTMQEDRSLWNQTISPTWYHIPTQTEWTSLVATLSSLLWISTLNYDYSMQYLLLPRSWQMTDSWTTIQYAETSWWWYYWSSTKASTTSAYILRSTSSVLNATWSAVTFPRWFPIRVFKDVSETPDSSRTKLN